MLRILGRRTSANVQKVVWLLAEIGVPFEREDVGGEFGGNKSAEYLRLNPNGTIPTLIDGDTVVWESNTILRYIANRFEATSFYPTLPGERAACERWMDWQIGTLSLCMTPLYVTLIRTAPENRDMAVLRRNGARAADLFGILDAALADRPYLAGQHLTLADLCTAIFAYRWFELAVERPMSYSHLRRWFEMIAERPAFKRHVMIGLS